MSGRLGGQGSADDAVDPSALFVLLGRDRHGEPLADAVRRGNAVGAIQVMSRGDNDGLPTRAELFAFMEGRRDWRKQA